MRLVQILLVISLIYCVRSKVKWNSSANLKFHCISLRHQNVFFFKSDGIDHKFCWSNLNNFSLSIPTIYIMSKTTYIYHINSNFESALILAVNAKHFICGPFNHPIDRSQRWLSVHNVRRAGFCKFRENGSNESKVCMARHRRVST